MSAPHPGEIAAAAAAARQGKGTRRSTAKKKSTRPRADATPVTSARGKDKEKSA